MAYRWNGVECDTFEELQRLQGAARTTSAVVKETRTIEAEKPRKKAKCAVCAGSGENRKAMRIADGGHGFYPDCLNCCGTGKVDK